MKISIKNSSELLLLSKDLLNSTYNLNLVTFELNPPPKVNYEYKYFKKIDFLIFLNSKSPTPPKILYQLTKSKKNA